MYEKKKKLLNPENDRILAKSFNLVNQNNLNNQSMKHSESDAILQTDKSDDFQEVSIRSCSDNDMNNEHEIVK